MSVDIRKFATDPLAFFDALIIPGAHGPSRFGESMAPFQRRWFQTVAPSLLAVAKGEKPPIGRFWCERTKGASKDSDCACALLWLLAFTTRPLTCQVGAADADQADELRRAAKDILRLNPWLSSRVTIMNWRILCEATGSQCDIIPADVAGSHGSRPDVLLANELSHLGKQEFVENLLDNASKKPRGLVVIATNAGHQSTWQQKWRDLAEESTRWHFHVFNQPAPWLDDAEIQEAARRNSRSRFERLYWGKWVSQSGDAIDGDDIQACIRAPGPLYAPLADRNWHYLAGLDLGVRQDHSALVIVAANLRSQQLRLASAQSWAPSSATGRVDLVAVERAVLQSRERFGTRLLIGYDPHEAGLLSQRVEMQGVRMTPINFTGHNLDRMASTLLDVFRSRSIDLFDHPALIRDLGRLTIVERGYGHKLESTRDQDGHADLAVALAIALPLAVDRISNPPARITVFGELPSPGDSDSDSPFADACEALERRRVAYAQEQQQLGPEDDQEPLRRALFLAGRTPL